MSKNNLGTDARPLLAAVIGSGPSGFYAAEALLKAKDVKAKVDMYDRLPTPYGLVRGGVAPDHAKIKSVTKVYEKIASEPGFRFFGNVKLGRDISVDDLKANYDVVIYAIGNETDRKLDIPGEDLEGSRTATEFVAWYNGHPDYRERTFDLSCERAVVVGIGNVAMDVTRVLAKSPEVLAKTDMADYAVEALRKSNIKEVYVLGRRGPVQAAFSPKEIMEIGEDPDIDLIVEPGDMEIDAASKASLEKDGDANAKKNVEYLLARSKKGEGSKDHKVRLRLCVSPVELIGENGKLKGVKIEKNELYEEGGRIKCRGTGKFEELPAGLLLRSVGYHGVETPGVPFDSKNGRVSNKDGRCADPESGDLLPGQYVVGWAKRGPSGLIGTNRADSVATVANLLEDLKGGKLAASGDKSPGAALAMVRKKRPKYVTFEDWKVLDRLELENGAKAGKERLKFTRIDDMLAALEAEKQKAPAA